MDTLNLVTRWLHILAAVILAGGIFFWQLVWLPSLTSAPSVAFEALRSKWAKWVGITTLLLLLTGLWNAMRNILDYDFARPGYHGWVAIKLVLGLVLFALAALLAGRTGLAQKMRARFSTWSCISCVLALVIILVGGYMRSIPRTPTATDAIDESGLSQPAISLPEGVGDGG